jgi:tRNA (pseudouridine54-N1)-methyltransferase
VRRFVVIGHTQRTDEIPLNDPAGAGRWDVLARSVAAAFLLSNGIRKDAEVDLVLQAPPRPRTLRLEGAKLRSLNPDERAILGLLSKALSVETVGDHWAQASAGIAVSRRDLSRILAEHAREGPVVLLHEEAPLLESKDAARPIAGGTFVLSDHQEFTPGDREAIQAHESHRFSLGPMSLHASNCIAIVNNWLDRL